MKKIMILIFVSFSLLQAEFIRDNTLEVVNDTTNNLMWQDNEDVKTVKESWQDAIDYCEALNFAGYDDWSLPNITELLSITDKTKSNPAMKSAFNNYSLTDGYWSSTPYANDANAMWSVSFYSATEKTENNTANGFIRCVRIGG